MLTRRRFAIVLAVLLVTALAAAAVSSWVWAKSYAPLHVTAYGPGSGVSPRPVGSSNDPACPDFTGCGRLAFVIHGKRRRIAEMHVVVRNDGRWGITIQRGDFHPYCSLPINADTCFELESMRPSRALGVPAHASADLRLRFRTNCRKRTTGYTTGLFALPLVYRYLGVFERTQNVTLPFDVDYLW